MPIRILHVIPTLGQGGAERQLVDVAGNSDRAGFEHVVCYFGPPDTYAADLRQAGLQVVGLNLPGRRRWLTAAARLRRLIKTHRPQLIHTWLSDASISARLACLTARGGPRIITSLQNPDYEPETIKAANWPPLKVNTLRRVDRLTARMTRDFFVPCSQFVAQSTMKYLGVPPTQMQVIYNSVDMRTLACAPDAPQQLRQELAIPAGGFVFVTVGRLDPQKGQADLLRAFRQVLAAMPDAYLALVGDGALAPALRQLAAELGIAARVKFLGRRRDVGACLAMADVFVFPTLFEGFGIALAEAMCKGLPCIATRTGPLPELITDGQTGLLVAPGAVEQLATAMLALGRDDMRRHMLATQGQQSAQRRFASNLIIPQWEALYRRVAQ
jgi:glycosyltransferase involved in cell wall biosynthesis